MKNLTLIYCGEDGDAGKALATSIRAKDSDNTVMLRSSEFFSGPDPEAHKVIIMPDVPEHKAMMLIEAYPKNIIDAVVVWTPPPHDVDDVVWTASGGTAAPEEKITIPPKRPRGRPRKVAA